MPVDVVKEPGDIDGPWECCCKCQKPTQFWFRPKDVALCQACALKVREEDIPTKAEWFKQ